ncbi:MAG TPA: SpoIIE family protein phosphatase [Egibacteraceae bacterium]|nr:SpoIIE family protein phosphatase [Egibacteraceae bacterium]
MHRQARAPGGPAIEADPGEILAALPDALLALDRSGVITHCTPAVESLLGWAAAELVGSPIGKLVPERLSSHYQAELERSLESSGSPLTGLPLRLPMLHSDGAEAAIDLTLSSPPAGGLIVATLRPADRGDQPTQDLGARFLADAGEILSSSLEYDTTLANVAALAVPFLADWCAIDLLEDGGSVRRLVVTHIDPEKRDAARMFTEAPPVLSSDAPVVVCMRTGRPQLFEEIDDAWLTATAHDEDHRRLLESVGFTSEIIVPLVGRERALGALTIAWAESGRHYDASDLLLAEELGRRAGMAVDNARLHADARDAEQRLHNLIDSLDGIVWEADPVTLRNTFVSLRAEDILGYPIQRWLEEPGFWESIIDPRDRDWVIEHCRAQLRERKAIDVEYRVRAADGRTVWLRDTSEPAPGHDGRMRRIRGLMTDITRRRSVEEDLRFQKALLESLNEASVEGVLVVSPGGEMLTFNRRFVELWGVPDEVVESRSDEAALKSVLDKIVDPDAFLRRVGEVYNQPFEPSRDEIALIDGRILDRYGTPVRSDDGDYLGYAWFFRDVTEERRAEVEIRETGERFERLARTLQQSLLPPLLPDIPMVDSASRYLPAGKALEVGGDFYDVFRTDRASWGVVMGDVSGKGVEAAAVTALTRYTLRAAAMQTRRPSSILRVLNEAIRREHHGERFATASYAALRPVDRGVRLTLANGGHPRPLILRRGGRVSPAGHVGTLLGLFADVELRDQRVELHPGDAIVFYTDGVIEARGPQGLFGEDRLRGLLCDNAGRSAEEIAAAIEHAVLEWQANGRDDTAVLVLRVRD